MKKSITWLSTLQPGKALCCFWKYEALFPGTTYDRTGNPDLKWESTTQTDIGLKWGI
jgi:hypothetical protein